MAEDFNSVNNPSDSVCFREERELMNICNETETPLIQNLSINGTEKPPSGIFVSASNHNSEVCALPSMADIAKQGRNTMGFSEPTVSSGYVANSVNDIQLLQSSISSSTSAVPGAVISIKGEPSLRNSITGSTSDVTSTKPTILNSVISQPQNSAAGVSKQLTPSTSSGQPRVVRFVPVIRSISDTQMHGSQPKATMIKIGGGSPTHLQPGSFF